MITGSLILLGSLHLCLDLCYFLMGGHFEYLLIIIKIIRNKYIIFEHNSGLHYNIYLSICPQPSQPPRLQSLPTKDLKRMS